MQEAAENGTATEKAQAFPDVAFKLDLGCFLNRSRCQKYQACPRICMKNITVVEPRSEVKNGVSNAPAHADRGSGLAGNHRKRKINGLANPHAQDVVVLQRTVKK